MPASLSNACVWAQEMAFGYSLMTKPQHYEDVEMVRWDSSRHLVKSFGRIWRNDDHSEIRISCWQAFVSHQTFLTTSRRRSVDDCMTVAHNLAQKVTYYPKEALVQFLLWGEYQGSVNSAPFEQEHIKIFNALSSAIDLIHNYCGEVNRDLNRFSYLYPEVWSMLDSLLPTEKVRWWWLWLWGLRLNATCFLEMHLQPAGTGG